MITALGRTLVVTFAFITSIAVGAWVAVRIGLEWLTVKQHADDHILMVVVEWVSDVLLNSQVMLSVASVPLILALGVVIVGEVSRIRSAVFYIVGGCIAAAAIPIMGSATSPTWQVFATAGFAAGGVYWVLAGRKA